MANGDQIAEWHSGSPVVAVRDSNAVSTVESERNGETR